MQLWSSSAGATPAWSSWAAGLQQQPCCNCSSGATLLGQLSWSMLEMLGWSNAGLEKLGCWVAVAVGLGLGQLSWSNAGAAGMG